MRVNTPYDKHHEMRAELPSESPSGDSLRLANAPRDGASPARCRTEIRVRLIDRAVEPYVVAGRMLRSFVRTEMRAWAESRKLGGAGRAAPESGVGRSGSLSNTRRTPSRFGAGPTRFGAGPTTEPSVKPERG